jgi:hypothetical protein
MAVNLQAFSIGIKEKMSGITFDDKIEDDKITVTASVTTKSYDDGIFIKIVAYESGTLHCFAVFDKIDRSTRVYELLDEFNASNSWFSAYISRINDKEFLELHYAVIKCEDTMNAVYNVQRFFDYLVDEDTVKKLKPLTELTY